MEIKIKSKNGFSLVEALVALAILSAASMAFMSMISNQNKELKATDEKIGLQGVQTQMMNILSSPNYCGCFLGGATFNYTTKKWNTGTFPTLMGSSYNSSCVSVGTPFLQVGTKMGSSNVKPTGMAMQNISETTTGEFMGDLVVQFDQSLMTRSRKSLTIPMFFKVNLLSGVPTARPLDSCSSSSSAPPIDLSTLCGQMGGVYNLLATPPCQMTYQ